MNRNKVLSVVNNRGEIDADYVLFYKGQQAVSFDLEAEAMTVFTSGQDIMFLCFDSINWDNVIAFKKTTL